MPNWKLDARTMNQIAMLLHPCIFMVKIHLCWPLVTMQNGSFATWECQFNCIRTGPRAFSTPPSVGTTIPMKRHIVEVGSDAATVKLVYHLPGWVANQLHPLGNLSGISHQKGTVFGCYCVSPPTPAGKRWKKHPGSIWLERLREVWRAQEIEKQKQKEPQQVLPHSLQGAWQHSMSSFQRGLRCLWHQWPCVCLLLCL